MRQRDMMFADWGISEQRRRKLMQEARREENLELLKIATWLSNDGLAPFLDVSLTSPALGKGQAELSSKGFRNAYIGDRWNRIYPPCKADDFYAYRRRALFIFDKILRLEASDEEIDFSTEIQAA